MKRQHNSLYIFVSTILYFATNELSEVEKDATICNIDYYARLVASQNDINYEDLQITQDNFNELTPQEKAFAIAHEFTNPSSQTKGEIKSNLIVCKSFLKTL